MNAAKKLGLTEDSIKVAFPARSIYLKGNNRIRTSLDLDELYKKEYIPKNAHLFTEFKGFSEYNASYDYEMFETFF